MVYRKMRLQAHFQQRIVKCLSYACLSHTAKHTLIVMNIYTVCFKATRFSIRVSFEITSKTRDAH